MPLTCHSPVGGFDLLPRAGGCDSQEPAGGLPCCGMDCLLTTFARFGSCFPWLRRLVLRRRGRFFRRRPRPCGVAAFCAHGGDGRREAFRIQVALLQEEQSARVVEVEECREGRLASRRPLPSLLEVLHRRRCAKGPAFDKKERVGLGIISHEPLKIVGKPAGLPRTIRPGRGDGFAVFLPRRARDTLCMELARHPLTSARRRAASFQIAYPEFAL